MRLLFLLSFFYAFFFIISPSPSQADPGRLELVMNINDTTVNAGTSEGYLSIYIDNFNYEIFGFQTVLKSNRPDLVLFDFSNGGFDTIGTLTGGFEFADATDPEGDLSTVWFRCIADLFYIPGTVDGFIPQQGGVAVKIPLLITSQVDTSLSLSSIISIETPTDFSDRFGYSIGVEVDTNYDTSYYQCALWETDSCLSWTEIFDPENGYDLVVYDTIPFGYLDTNQVKLYDGSVTLHLLNCDININGTWDISDLLCLVDMIFGEVNPTDCPLIQCDTDANNQLDISDLLYIIDFFFINGPPPPP